MFLRKIYVTSNASRDSYKLHPHWSLKPLFKLQRYRRYSHAGRGLAKKIIIYSKKGFSLRKLKPQINYKNRLQTLSFVTSFKLIPFENKLVALMFSATGSFSYIPLPENSKLFKILHFPVFNPNIRVNFKEPVFFILYYLRKLVTVSLLELYPGYGIQYARSSGTAAKMLKIDKDSGLVLIRLPSGVRKLFSIYALTSTGPVSLKLKKKIIKRSAGFSVIHGKKPQVRGVAKNPVDHPHGGRTKSIKFPRTPWGKPTKLK